MRNSQIHTEINFGNFNAVRNTFFFFLFNDTSKTEWDNNFNLRLKRIKCSHHKHWRMETT